MGKIKQASEILQDAADEINELLKNDHAHINDRLQMDVKKTIGRLSFFTGSDPSSGTSERPKHEPVTVFMGEVIATAKPITDADLNPDVDEVKQLNEKVNKLYLLIDTLTPDSVLNAYDNAANEIVLRGVAKKAGIEDYDTCDLNIPLIDAIVDAKKQAAADALTDADLEARLKAQEALFAGVANPDPDPNATKDPAPDAIVDAKKQAAKPAPAKK